MKPIKATLLGFAVLLPLLGCAGAEPPPGPATHLFETNALNALRLGQPGQASAALGAALTHYESRDDLHGQWRIHLLSARLALANNDEAAAKMHASRVESLASYLTDNETRYQTALLQGQVSNNESAWREALRFANSDLQQAVAQTYLGNSNVAIALLGDGQDHPADRAFVYYQHGRAEGSDASLLKALDFYRAADDSRGIADALMGLAMSARGTRPAAARRYAERAIIVLSASGDSDRAEAAKAWLNQQ